jgi:hypothetical protein
MSTFIHYITLERHQFLGFFLLNDDELFEDHYETETCCESAYPILGFTTSFIPSEIVIASNNDYESPVNKKQSNNSKLKKSISMKFSSLDKPDEFFNFAEEYGSLFNFREKMTIHEIFPIDEKSLLEAFSLPKGTKSKHAMRLSLKNKVIEKPQCYETLDSWLVASQLLRLAFTLNRLLKDGFEYMEINNAASASRVYSVKIAENSTVNFIIDRIDKTSVYTSLITTINDNEDEDYLSIFKNRKSFYTTSSDTGVHQKFNLHHIDYNGSRQFRIASSDLDGRRTVKELISDTLQGAFDCLVNFHLSNVNFKSDNGKIYYEFSSLISYIWFDAFSALNGLVEISTCDYCGKPFFRNNHGQRKRFCDETCRKNANNKSKKTQSENKVSL